MDSQLTKLLIVEDSPEDIRLLIQALKKDFLTTVATSADDALQIISDTLPDVVLMDINMPGTDGYTACSILKDCPETADIDIIFLSSNDSTDEVLKGFNAGASDYVVKPYEPRILLSKIHACIQRRKGLQQCTEAARYAGAVAMSAMSDTGDLGTIVNFLRTSFAIKTIEDLCTEICTEICTALSAFGLNACAHIYLEHSGVFHGTDASPSELEINLIKRIIHNPEPIVTIGNRLLLIKPGVVLLIKNLPGCQEKSARIKDHLMILLEGITAKVASLSSQEKLSDLLSGNINRVIKEAEVALINIRHRQEAHKKQSIEIMDEMVTQVEASFLTMGLNDQQEEQLLEIMTRSVTESLNHFELGLEIDDKISHIIDSLSTVSMDAKVL
ncbi:MAG TPA: response regulator [Cellvibrionaceae bacterium]